MTTKPRVENVLADALEKATHRRPVLDHVFHPERRWKFDVAYPTAKLAVEINGRFHLVQSQHRKDCEKINAALEMGWRVLQYPASVVTTKARLPLVVEQITRVLCGAIDVYSAAEVMTGPLRRAA